MHTLQPGPLRQIHPPRLLTSTHFRSLSLSISPAADALDLWTAALEAHRAEAIEIQSEEVYERYMKYLIGCADKFRIGYLDVNQFTLEKE
jgi:cyclopropane fatty-acyl-phospholipid synthase-like methyltransferase